ncbi:MAG: hypothetical protein LBJ70_02720 [Holosporales bacterium]|nr:hypothetical protein [Holosporales bacterium]
MLVLSETGALLADPARRHFRPLSYGDLPQACASYPFLRLFSDQQSLTFSLASLPSVPFWQRPNMIRLNLTPSFPGDWRAFPLASFRETLSTLKRRFFSNKRPFSRQNSVSFVPFQRVALPQWSAVQLPSLPGLYLSGIEPLLLGLPSFCAHILGSVLRPEMWWMYAAPHSLSGMRLVVGKGKGIALCRTLHSSDYAAEMQQTLQYLPRLGWEGDPIHGCFVETPGLYAAGATHPFLRAARFSLLEAARRAKCCVPLPGSMEELLLRWILRRGPHIPTLGPAPLRWRRRLLLLLKSLRPIFFGGACLCCGLALHACFQVHFLRRHMQSQQEQMQAITQEATHLETSCAQSLPQSPWDLDLSEALAQLEDLEQDARFLRKRRERALLPQLRKLAPLFSQQALKSLTVAMEQPMDLSFTIALFPSEQEALQKRLQWLFPEATLIVPPMAASTCFFSAEAPVRTVVTIAMRHNLCQKGS